MNREMIDEVVQEFELHQMLVQNIDCLPAEMRSRPDASFLAWASELRLHDAGKNGGDGWADLLIVDELGKSWIIEVKLSTNTELNANVWQQLIRYRDSAMQMSWADIHNYADRFLDGMGRVKPISDSFYNKESLVDVVKQWQTMLGRALIPAEDIVRSVAASLKDGSIGLAVIADRRCETVINGADNVQHTGDLAYITVAPVSGQLDLDSKFIRSGKAVSHKAPSEIVNEVFYKCKNEKKTKLTASILEERLNPVSLASWRKIIRPALLELGWDGSIAYEAEKGMTLNVICKGEPAAIVRIAFSDADAKDIDRKFKIPGTYGLRIDFTPWYIKGKFSRPDISKEDIERFAGKLYALGWRGSGTAKKTAGTASIPDDIYLKWSYMRYYPSGKVKDFLGRDDDPEKIEAFFDEMKSFCQ
jgi:hypothetical protein